MFHQDESDLSSAESQPPSRGEVTSPWVRNALQVHINNVTEEVSAPPS